MSTIERTVITVETTVNAPVEKVWDILTNPKHIVRWNSATPEWHTPYATSDLRPGGKLLYRMEARDGSMGFDMTGEFTIVQPPALLEFKMDDGRYVRTSLTGVADSTVIRQSFEAEEQNSEEMQRNGWQAILNNLKKYTERKDLELLEFKMKINAPVEKVYATMLEEDSYRKWTAIFNEHSHYKGTWQRGSKIHFIGMDKDGNKGGMVSIIKENKPNQFISIEHIGLLEGDKEVTTGKEVEGWAGSLENYTFIPDGNATVVEIDMDANQDFKNYFAETWPNALDKLKEISEQ